MDENGVRVVHALALATAWCCAPAGASAAPGEAKFLPTGQVVTPLAAPGSAAYPLATGLRADGNADGADASATALSPDGTRLLVLTSGYNLKFRSEAGAPLVHLPYDPATGGFATGARPLEKAEWVFVYDVTHAVPALVQRIPIPNTFSGLAWSNGGRSFFVSGGIDDRVYRFDRHGASYAGAPALVLGHNSNAAKPVPAYDGGILKGTPAGRLAPALLPTGAVVAGVAASRDGRILFAANLENDSLSIVDLATRAVRDVAFFRPGERIARGEYPSAVAVRSIPGGGAEAFVTSVRDDEVLVAGERGAVSAIPVGRAPAAVAFAPDGRTLYVCNADDDSLSVVDAGARRVVATVPLGRDGERLRGSNPNGLAVAPDGRRVYVTLGAENAVAVFDATRRRVLGRIPTGWYPTGVAVSRDGRRLFVVNEKSAPGADPDNGFTTPAGTARNTTHQNQYGWAQEKASLVVVPVPSPATLGALSRLVDHNDGFDRRATPPIMTFLRGKIRHVIYITNENRTYDQVLGDLAGANGDPELATFPQRVSPNHHALATGFVTFDNFFDAGESSGVGWNWSLQGHTNDYTERSQAVLYGNAEYKGLTYDYQGSNRNVNLRLPQTGGTTPFDERVTGLLDPSGASSILPGSRDVAATAGDGDLDPAATGGYLWDEALRHGLSVRDYGEHVDIAWYGASVPGAIPMTRTPYAANVPQAPPEKDVLVDRTDVFYRGFDQAYPDTFRYEEWRREFDEFVATGTLPNLEVMTLPHDHFGSFGTALEGLTTPALQFADNDYALGKVVDAVSHSRYWKDTAIVVLEDDSQSGPDHVDTHRSLAYVLGPYVRRGAVDHTAYTTDAALRTIEELLGLGALGIEDANAPPMSTAFTTQPDFRPYDALVPASLCGDPVPRDFLGAACIARTSSAPPLHDGAWWAAMTAGMDFSRPDAVDAARFNALLWYGSTGTLAPRDVASR